MRFRSCAPLVVSTLLCCPALSRAQTAARPLEVAADLGLGSFINGATFGQMARGVGGTIDWRPFPGPARRFGVELRLLRVTHDEEYGPAHYNRLSSSVRAGNAVLHFRPNARTQPYLLAGVGIIKASASYECDTCGYKVDAAGNKVYFAYGQSEHGAETAVLYGAGFKTLVGKHVVIRAEALEVHAVRATYESIFLDGSPRDRGKWEWQTLSIGAGWRF